MHGGARPSEYNLVDFSANINPWHPEIEIRDCERYPYGDFDKIVANFVGKEVAVTAGITEAIYLIFLLKEGDVTVMRHTYGEYERVAKIFKRKIHYVEGLDPNFEEFYIPRNGIIFLCNPNNPTGIMKGEKFVNALVDMACDKNSLVFLDEAYVDFSREIRIKGDCVVRARTFTKVFGIPGIRVGYVTAHLDEFRRIRGPWGLGCAGASFLHWLMENGREFLDATIPKILKERDRISNILNLKSDANFFLLNVGSGKDFREFAKNNRVLVRDCSSFGLPEYIRFSVRRREENDILIETIEKWFEGGIP